MSGHSKWHNIQAKKGVEDAKRGRAFTKITREIIIAAKGRWRKSRNEYASQGGSREGQVCRNAQ